MALPQEQLPTIKEYEALPPDIRAEVFDGQIQYMASPSQVNQEISSELHYLIKDYIKTKNGDCKIFSAPFDVKLNDTPLTIVQPDIMVICDKDKLDGKRCNGAPDFIIEIVSPGSVRMDYSVKLFKYRLAGVREYWIVNPIKNQILAYFFESDDVIEYTFQDNVKVNIYEDFEIDFSQINI